MKEEFRLIPSLISFSLSLSLSPHLHVPLPPPSSLPCAVCVYVRLLQLGCTAADVVVVVFDPTPEPFVQKESQLKRREYERRQERE